MKQKPKAEMHTNSSPGTETLLDIQDLSLEYRTKRGNLQAVYNASLSIKKGESVAIIGESGCGKTTLATSIVNMLPLNARITHGKILYKNRKGKLIRLENASESTLRTVRWSEIVMMFQTSQSSFNPVSKIESQFIDTVRAHTPNANNEEILRKSRKLLEMVYLDGDRVLKAYPHELSGGMKQRTMIALALLLDPQLVILDEPTTALDLITQKKILELLNSLRGLLGFSMMFITHDLGIVTQLADRVVTMYAGSIVEDSPSREFFARPIHPYSKGLLHAVPKLDAEFKELYSIPGTTPDLVEKIEGCLFSPRCTYAIEVCTRVVPPLETALPGRKVACHVCGKPQGDAK
jgi:peptide/nickel transport system ATP-binding protein